MCMQLVHTSANFRYAHFAITNMWAHHNHDIPLSIERNPAAPGISNAFHDSMECNEIAHCGKELTLPIPALSDQWCIQLTLHAPRPSATSQQATARKMARALSMSLTIMKAWPWLFDISNVTKHTYHSLESTTTTKFKCVPTN